MLNYVNIHSYLVKATRNLAVEHSQFICNFILQSIYSQASMNKTDLDEVILPFFMRKISHIWIFIRTSQYGFSNAWLNLFLGWKVKSLQHTEILRGQRVHKGIRTYWVWKLPRFPEPPVYEIRINCKRTTETLSPKRIQSSSYLCPRVQGPSTLMYETLVFENPEKLFQK